MSPDNGNDGRTDPDAPETDHRTANPADVAKATSPARVERTHVGWRTRARQAVLVLISATLLSIVVVIASFGPPGDPDVRTPRVPPPYAPTPPCDRLSDQELERLGRQWWMSIDERLRRETFPETDRALEHHVDTAFEPVYANIPGFMDWHYSIAGQYTELALAVVNRLENSELVRSALDRLVESELAQDVVEMLRKWEFTEAVLDQLQTNFDRLQAALDQLQQGMDSRLLGELPGRIQHAAARIEQVAQEEMHNLVAQRIHDAVLMLPSARAMPGAPCAEGEAAELRTAYERMLRAAIPHTVQRFTGSVVPTVIVAAGAAVRGAVAGRAIIRSLSRRMFPRAARRIASTGASATAGAAVGSALGPVGAAVGGLAAGAAAWLIVDLGVLLVDRYDRVDLERELTAVVDEMKAEAKAAMTSAVEEARSEALGERTPSQLNSRN